MKISYSWLKDYLSDTISPQEIADALPMIGLEVESIEERGLPPTDHLVVGQVLSREAHPNADRLGVCQVQVAAAEEPVQIVCGATNYQVGDRVPVALPGALLPGGFKIKKSKLRGVVSNGMMCSARELGLGADHAGLLILEGQPEVGTPMQDVYPDRDTLFEIELTANRGDCLGHIGVARDLAAFFRIELQLPEVPELKGTGDGLLRAVDVTTDDCPYYTAWSLRGVSIGPSPDWLRQRIEAVGLRPINNVVDVTNYVLYETGQPLHAFDAAKIRGGKLVVRAARADERITTLDDKTHTLAPTDCVIADAERPLVIAGVMGSIDAEVDSSTTDIVLESAYFRPAAVRASSRRLNLHTDSSYRFARDVDPAGVALWARRALHLMQKVAGGEISGDCLVAGQAPRGDREIAIDGDYIRQKCGYAIEDERIVDVFVHLGFTIRDNPQSGGWFVTVPSFRPEVDRPIDLVEEFVRIDGTANIPAVAVRAAGLHRNDDRVALFNQRAQDFLVARQFQECCHYSLCEGTTLAEWGTDAAALALANPLTSELSHLRASLLPGLLQALRLNRSHGSGGRRFFETGRVFEASEEGLRELCAVAFVLAVDDPGQNWRQREAPDFYSARTLLEALAALLPGSLPEWQQAGDGPVWQTGHAALAERAELRLKAGLLKVERLKALSIDGLILAGELTLPPECLSGQEETITTYQPFSDQPATERDVALVVPAAMPAASVAEALLEIARRVAGERFQVEAVRVFDVYTGSGLPEGAKSLALSMRFRAPDRTLTDSEVNAAFTEIQQSLKAANYTLRQ